MDLIIHWISTYGYAAIYVLLMLGIVGLPIPDETMLVFSGYLIAQGHLQPVPTVIVAFLGSASGITLSYVIGRTLGLGVVHKFGRYMHLTDERLQKVHGWFDRVGHWALLIGYYIAGVRHLTALIAGTSKLEYRSFALFAYTGALIWACTFLAIGYFFGEHWQQVAELIHKNLLLVSVVVIVLAIAYVMFRRYRSRK